MENKTMMDSLEITTSCDLKFGFLNDQIKEL